MKKNKRNLGKIISASTTVFAIFFAGMVLGMTYQQMLTKQAVIDALTYSNVEVNVNLNETLLIEEFNRTIVPQLNQEFNSSLDDDGK